MADLETAPKSVAPAPVKNCFAADAGLRVLLFAAALTSVIVMVTSKQTEMVPVPGLPLSVPLPAKFNQSPAFIYFVAALSVACLYSIITAVASISAVVGVGASSSTTKKLLFHFAVFDTIILGIVASAVGTAGGVGYMGLKGNSHVRWAEICNRYDKFCSHVGGSVAVSLFASLILVFLVILSVLSLYKRIP